MIGANSYDWGESLPSIALQEAERKLLMRGNGRETGKIGNDSAAARFAAATAQSGFVIEESKPYAEVSYLYYVSFVFIKFC